GWRYLRLKPRDILEMTHREIFMLCEENIEYTHDENEYQAMYAIMYAAERRGKGKKQKLPSIKELYDRKSLEGKERESEVDPIEEQRKAEEWLANFDLTKFNKKEGE